MEWSLLIHVTYSSTRRPVYRNLILSAKQGKIPRLAETGSLISELKE